MANSLSTTSKPDLTSYNLSEEEQKLADVFLYEKPWELIYPNKGKTWLTDKPVLEKLMAKGLVHIVNRDTKRMHYRLVIKAKTI